MARAESGPLLSPAPRRTSVNPVKIMTSMSVRPLLSAPARDAEPAPAKTAASPWMWMVVTCLRLGLSGGIRFWRDWQFRLRAERDAVCPFPLNELPKAMGGWQWIEGSESQLEPEVARTAGSSDNILRDYVNEKTADRIAVMALYGLATTVLAHAPDICYPGQGYRVVMPPEDRPLSIPGLKAPAVCRAAIYAKKVGPSERYEVVYHTFYHNGQWVPELASHWKSFRYHPGAFKIQLQRTISGQLTLEDGPSESLLSQLIQEINRHTSPNPGGAADPAAPVQAASAATPLERGARSG